LEVTVLHKRLIYLIFSLSGSCALVYEILWSKYLSLTFGNTMIAVSVVAATFMAGLALGSYLLGRYSDRDANLLKTYALLEIGIAITALLFAPTLSVVEHLYAYWVQLLPNVPGLTPSIHIFFSSMLLLPPSICMGGTFPLMCRFFARRKSGAQIGRLYALNTLGATLGTFSAGYLLIPTLGLSHTGFLAIFGNLAIAGICFALSKRYGAVDADGKADEIMASQHLDLAKHRPILIAVALIGFLSLGYEILWTRVLLLFLGNTSYAFSLMLSVYLVCVAIGGYLYACFSNPEMNERKVFLVLSLMMSGSVFLTIPFYDKLAHLFQFAHEVSGENWWLLTLLSFVIVFFVIGLPTILSGALLPAAVGIIDPGKKHTGQGVGMVVLHNTTGAVLGSLAAGFIMVPAFGLLNSFKYLAVVNLIMVFVLALQFRQRGVLGRVVPSVAIAGILLGFAPMSWDAKLMNSGVYCYASKYSKMGGLESVLASERILEVIEGRDCTVAVHESNGGDFRFFSVNGKTDGGTGGDMSTQFLIGQIPLMLHQAPKDVLVIGLGTGLTLKGMSSHPVESIDCVEISPEVVKAEKYFKEFNGNALAEPKVNLFVTDGRNLLFTNTKKYDVIVSEPSNPWQSGNSNLFTDDFYQIAVDRLKEGGLFCQWIGLYDITVENLQIVSQTFLHNFPRALIFKSGSDLILIGSTSPFEIDYQRMKNRFSNKTTAEIMRSINLRSPGDLIAKHYLFDEDTLRSLAGNAILNTDDQPTLEYSAHHNVGDKTLGAFQMDNMAAINETIPSKTMLPVRNLGSQKQAVAQALREIGAGYAMVGSYAIAKHFMVKAESID
jgi:spermidine synthase